MDSVEILNAVEEATTNIKMDKTTLNRDTRYKFSYSDDNLFDKPVIIRGTNKQLVPFDSIVSFEGEDKCSVDEVIRMCENVDNNLDIGTVEDVSDIKMNFINDSYILLHDPKFNDGAGIYWMIATPQRESKKESVAFRKWSELLKIPYSYAKKNPGHLNEANFGYWKNMLTITQDQKVSIDIIYLKESVEVNLDDGNIVQAYVVVNVLRSEVVYENKDVIHEVVHSELSNRVPLMSKILDNVQTQIKSCIPEVEIKMQQYSLGYTGLNKGRHYTRLVLEHPKFAFEVYDGETMFPAITLESDFLGKCKDFGEVIISFSLYREVCSNGLVVNWNERQKKDFRERFVLNYLQNRGIVDGMESYTTVAAEANSKFNAVFVANGVKIPVNLSNAIFPSSLFKQMLEFFLGTLGYMEESLLELITDEFEDLSEKEFVLTVHSVAEGMKIPKDIIKFLIIEYIAGNFPNQNQIFKTPLDILNFITFLCKVYDSSVQLDVERKAYTFAYTLMQILIHKKKIDESAYNNYFNQVNQDIL